MVLPKLEDIEFCICSPSASAGRLGIGFLGFSGEAGDTHACSFRFAWDLFKIHTVMSLTGYLYPHFDSSPIENNS